MSTAPSAGPATNGVADAVLALCRQAESAVAGGPLADRAAGVRARLEGPLQVAIAGRVKAGKSTLLNALVGERLAPTDAGECTRIVSWYRRGQGYDVEAKLHGGERRTLAFTREGGALDIELGSLSPADVEAIDVRWPSSQLEQLTLIDTPGLASLDDANSRRTQEFLAHDAAHSSDADAVIYLMRHLHRRDVEFLDAFMDRSVTGASPVNSVAVLSRADEIGAGRLDALESAARIADRYRNEPEVRSLCATVVPLAGLLAETGLTLREDEAAALRLLAQTPADELDRMLLSSDQFCELEASQVTVELRRSLLERLGLFGVRFAMAEISAGRATGAADLAPRLVERSGLQGLRRLIAEHFLPRARLLKARSALVALRALAADLRAADAQAADHLGREAERIEAGAIEFAQLRVAHLVLSGSVELSEDQRAEVERVVLAPTREQALGIAAGSPPDASRQAALAGIERWRARAANPIAAPVFVETCETIARTYEGIFATLGS
jgi:Dynamin family